MYLKTLGVSNLHQEWHSFVRKLLLRFITNLVQDIDKIGDIDLYCASAVFVKAKVYIQACTDLSLVRLKISKRNVETFGWKLLSMQ